MDVIEYPTPLQDLVLDLEKRYNNLKKIDVFKAVSNAYKNIKPMFQHLSTKDLEEIKHVAVKELNS